MSEVNPINRENDKPPNQIVGYKHPPLDKSFGAGPLANKPGRPKNAGSTIKEWVNSLVAQDLSEDDLRAVWRDKRAPATRRLAAARLLTALERPDMADFEPALDGQLNLRELRSQGLDTAIVKKCKTKRRTLPGADGVEIEEVEREIELHDRSQAAWRDIIDDTDGKPAQTVQVNQRVQVQAVVVQIEGITAVPAGFGLLPSESIVPLAGATDGE